ncbi:hypothetical protein OGATHE_006650 [Ogataea polymorpha]|uniref:Uncharacterized protein n=1 Tax=Ogataea polymorpha TaxID=460523 RepID=A0A9P8SY93_9ASCO|nr:hypothetical protein OGATHE_006650 [Ogataea polymorpha]
MRGSATIWARSSSSCLEFSCTDNSEIMDRNVFSLDRIIDPTELDESVCSFSKSAIFDFRYVTKVMSTSLEILL